MQSGDLVFAITAPYGANVARPADAAAPASWYSQVPGCSYLAVGSEVPLRGTLAGGGACSYVPRRRAMDTASQPDCSFQR